MVAAQHPDLIADLVLIDPADEIYWSKLSPEIRRQSTDTGTMVIERHAAGELAPMVRESFAPFVNRLTDNQLHRNLLLDAYESCYLNDWPITVKPAGQHGFQVVSLPEVPAAATLIHHGSMDHVLPSVQALARWIDANGYRSLGYARELTLEFSDKRDQWVTELQEPITT